MRAQTITRLLLLSAFSGMFILLAAEASADGKLSFAKSSDSMIEVHLENNEPVAGLQFAVRSSGNISLQTIVLGGRTAGAWMISYNTVSDSEMFVILIRTGRENLSAGSGTIALLTIRTGDNADGPCTLSFDDVVAAGPAATALTVSAEPLEWSGDAPSFALRQNYPNPFNPSTTIPYDLRQPSHVRATVYDIAGREIRRIFEGVVPAGEHSATWNGIDESGAAVPSGVYFVRLQVGGKSDVRKMILAR